MAEFSDIIAALKPVAESLANIKVGFFVGGSVASSFHGASRSTMDVDIVADIGNSDVEPLLQDLGDEYYASQTAIFDAIEKKSCFNLIHYPTAFKVDVFVFKGRPFDIQSMKRSIKGRLDFDSGFDVPIASAEDTILSKLEWFRLGNETSQRQWEDVTRVLKILGEQADLEYMKLAAENLGVSDLLKRLLAENP